MISGMILGAVLFVAGFATGWYFNRKRFTILSGKSMDEGMENLKRDAAKKWQKDGQSAMDNFLKEMNKTLQQEVGVNVDPANFNISQDGKVWKPQRTSL